MPIFWKAVAVRYLEGINLKVVAAAANVMVPLRTQNRAFFEMHRMLDDYSEKDVVKKFVYK